MYNTNPEYLTLRKLTNILGIEGGTIIDIGAHDGISSSCTYPFWKDEPSKWYGIAVEIDPTRCAQMINLYTGLNVAVENVKIIPDNVCDIIEQYEIEGDIAILNMDIDSYDLEVTETLLKGGHKPLIITIEVNPIVPPPIYFEILYHPEQEHRANNFFGCSITAAMEKIIPHGYVLYSYEIGNAFFIREDIAKNKIKSITADEAYDMGYRKMPDWKEHFWYHENLRQWLDMSAEQVLVEIQKHFDDIIAGEGPYVNPSWPGKYWWKPKYILEMRK